MINDKQLVETLVGESAPKCADANGGIRCHQPVVECFVPFPRTTALWFCQRHWDERKAERSKREPGKYLIVT